MGIKFSVGVSDTSEDRERLEELRRRPPVAVRTRDDGTRRPEPALGWSLRAVPEDEAEPGEQLWAW